MYTDEVRKWVWMYRKGRGRKEGKKEGTSSWISSCQSPSLFSAIHPTHLSLSLSSRRRSPFLATVSSNRRSLLLHKKRKKTRSASQGERDSFFLFLSFFRLFLRSSFGTHVELRIRSWYERCRLGSSQVRLARGFGHGSERERKRRVDGWLERNERTGRLLRFGFASLSFAWSPCKRGKS